MQSLCVSVSVSVSVNGTVKTTCRIPLQLKWERQLALLSLHLNLRTVNVCFPVQIRHVSYYMCLYYSFFITKNQIVGLQKLVLLVTDIVQTSIRYDQIQNPK
jgi:hypothetical protein